ncbi:MAG: hypothetical protein ACOX8L_00940 [Candidatus Methanomethylophilaceae archaeon]|jgi:predicted transcriptional regulator
MLVFLGIHRNAAKIFLHMAVNGSTTSDDLEKALNMGQPSVSTAIKFLNDMNWLRTEFIRSDGKGRPRHRYSLAEDLDTTIGEIENLVNEAICRLNDGLESLKVL